MIEQLRERVSDLSAMERRLQDCLTDVRAAHAIAVAELEQAAKQDIGLRPLGVVGVPNGFRQGHIKLEEVRDAVCKLKHFAIGELAAELGCSTARARKELDRVAHLIKPNGHLGARQLWAYVPPDGPGKAFEQQRRLRTVDLPIPTGSSDIKQSMLSSISDKEIKKAVREALADGWELVKVGGKHPFALVKGGRTVGFASSPKNSGHAANALRRDLRAA